MNRVFPEVKVTADKYEFAMQVAAEAGRDEPNRQDEIDGIRMLIDTAIASANQKGA